jgi:hypothetical protein
MSNENINTPETENALVPEASSETSAAETPEPETIATPAEPPVEPTPADQPPLTSEAQPAEPLNPPSPLYQGGDNLPNPTLQGGQNGIMALLKKANEKIQFRKCAKLEKIMVLVGTKGKITNDDVQKLLRCSDATATRYLAELVKQGKLMPSGKGPASVYEIMN